MKKFVFNTITIIILITGILTLVLSGCDGTRSITVISVSGDEAYIIRESDRQFSVREGTRLTAGSTIKTGSTTTIDVLPGDGSPVRINESSEVYISELSKNDLALTVVTGSISDISSEYPENDNTIHAGNITMGLRGVTNDEQNKENNMLVITRDGMSDAAEHSEQAVDDTSSWWTRAWEMFIGWVTR